MYMYIDYAYYSGKVKALMSDIHTYTVILHMAY